MIEHLFDSGLIYGMAFLLLLPILPFAIPVFPRKGELDD